MTIDQIKLGCRELFAWIHRIDILKKTVFQYISNGVANYPTLI